MYLSNWLAKFLAAGILLGSPLSYAVTIQPNDVIVADFPSKNIIRIDSNTGEQEVINTELLPGHPIAVEYTRRGILVLVDTVDALINVDPATGDYRYLSSQGNLIKSPINFFYWPTTTNSGPKYTAFITTGDNASIVKLDLSTGLETLVTSGGTLTNTSAIIGTYYYQTVNGHRVLEKLVVSDNNTNSLLEVDIATGAQSILASGGLINDPVNIDYTRALGYWGEYRSFVELVLSNRGTNNIISVNTQTGEQKILINAHENFFPSGIATTYGNYFISMAFFGDIYSRQLYKANLSNSSKEVISSNGFFNSISDVSATYYLDSDNDAVPDEIDHCPETTRIGGNNINIGSCTARGLNQRTPIEGCTIEQLFENCISDNSTFREFKACARDINKQLLVWGGEEVLFFDRISLSLINQCLQPKNFSF